MGAMLEITTVFGRVPTGVIAVSLGEGDDWGREGLVAMETL